ncbi:MAG TPA: outer membrane beta-barrel protein [Longimicrobium sp.]
MMKKTMLLSLVAAVALAGTAQAQTGTLPTSPLSVDVRAGAAFPTGDFGDIAEMGYTVGGDLSFMLSPTFSLYAGGTYNSFAVADEFQELIEGLTGAQLDDLTYNLFGVDAGVKVAFPSATGFTPFLRGGLVYYTAELGGGDELGEDVTEDNDYEAGFEVGGGLAFPLGPRISVTPAVSYTDIDDLNFVRAQIGLNFRF